MAVQLRLLAAGSAIASGTWMYHVSKERAKIPQGRRRQFTPGSADDIMSEALKSGDLVLFARDCSLYYPAGAAVCWGNKAVTGVPFDHVGVVVMWHGFPMVAEWTFGGVKIRPFDERLKCSRAREVAVRPLATPLTPEAEAALKRTVSYTSQARQGSVLDTIAWLAGPAPPSPPPSDSTPAAATGQRVLPPMPGWKPRPPDFDAPASTSGAANWGAPPPQDGDWHDVERHTRPTAAVGVRDVPPLLHTLGALGSLALGREANKSAQFAATLYGAAGLLPGTAPLPPTGGGVVAGVSGAATPLDGLDWQAVAQHESMTTWAPGGIDALGAVDAPVPFLDPIVFRDT